MYDLPGCYRPLLARPTDWAADVVPYRDPYATIEPTDMDLLASKPPAATADAPPAATANGDAAAAARPVRWAWRLQFTLPPSVYATMLLREVLHEPIEPEEHTRRAKAATAKARLA